MKTSNLVDIWKAPDNTRLTSKQYSFRLPVHVAAKLSALCDLYPNKTRTQIVGDLLSTALNDVQEALPSFQGRPWHNYQDDNGNDLFYATGPAAEFRGLTNKYYKELEIELGTENPAPFFDSDLLWQE